MGLKKVLKKIIPSPIFKVKNYFFGPKKFVWFTFYQNWQDAENDAEGYNASDILEKCKSSLIKVRDGEAVYERDSMLFDEIQYSWGLLAGLQKAAIEYGNELCVLDFGGSLGSSYFQNKGFLEPLKNLEWCIVEQENFVKCGQEEFENDQLKFYYTISECLKEHKPNVLLLSSVIQYLADPITWIKYFLSLDIPYIIIDRTAFTQDSQDLVCLQRVPDYIYHASYPCWFFEKERFIKHFQDKYNILGYFDSGYTHSQVLNGKKIYWDGLILKRNEIS
ncbi:methyltransferase, TIGR04325 family [Pedobacter sp. LMG 31464]|uniref:Methyltransferase, TIGR04325 family n=1 Tax=Pedobacter planticolens TaxID=2679964 RepID=A0A923DWT0_9SPHI|nr:methyltransferase, TIGR04325 family [Pedobacter planticolens]MBB2144110.1 methyltransferase, TIGR04325 family [Pedobacter planticolens]